MRLAAGLSFPSQGSISLFGRRGEKALQEERKRIGCMIEYPGIIGNMNAKENLRVRRVLKGIPNEENEEDLLKLVGLSKAGNKKAKDLLDEKCKRHIRIRCAETSKLAAVLEESLHTSNDKVMPDGSVKLYDCLERQEQVASRKPYIKTDWQ